MNYKLFSKLLKKHPVYEKLFLHKIYNIHHVSFNYNHSSDLTFSFGFSGELMIFIYKVCISIKCNHFIPFLFFREFIGWTIQNTACQNDDFPISHFIIKNNKWTGGILSKNLNVLMLFVLIILFIERIERRLPIQLSNKIPCCNLIESTFKCVVETWYVEISEIIVIYLLCKIVATLLLLAKTLANNVFNDVFANFSLCALSVYF